MRRAIVLSTALLALSAPVAIGFGSASAAPEKPQKAKCSPSNGKDVTVDREANTVTVLNDPSTGGNNLGCRYAIDIDAGDQITFNYTGTCGGGSPRIFLRFDDAPSTNTYDGNPTACGGGTSTYTFTQDGTLNAFALINDFNPGTVTFSNLTIAGTVVDF